ncbi:MAG: dihydrolipoyl dehydrogenase [Dysgonamonadaceae bacterium]|jgi:dihydrolipoamide dehydrogenase|nr:dihydrolipoyl dehydrogenase [Dysgonamonadaceae bacterium]
MIYDVAIIGGGPAGYTAAELAGKNGLKTVLFEKNSLGGVCLNEGCIPTKTLLYSAKTYYTAKESAKYGISCENVTFDLPKIISRKNKIVRKLVAGVKSKMAEANVDVVVGEAVVTDNSTDGNITIKCNEQLWQAKKLILCSGSETIIPPIPGLKETDFWTSREALENKEIPETLLIIGGGVIGIEFASFFNVLGTKVIVVEMLDEILGGMDKELSGLLRNELAKKGIDFHLNTKVIAVDGNKVEIEKDGEKQFLTISRILLGAGRKPVLSGLKVNEFMQTSNPNVYACGDITGFSLLAHTAIREAEVAIEHILGKNRPMSYKAVPGVVYTNPEIACVGKTEDALQKEGITYKVKKLPMSYSGRFVAENEMGNGVCKIIESDDGTLLGVHLLGNPSSEIIVIAGIAIDMEMKVDELKSVIFPHPTVGEIIKETL